MSSPPTKFEKAGLEAAILAYLTKEGDRFARTVAAFKEELRAPGSGNGSDGGNGDGGAATFAFVSGSVLEEAWEFVSNEVDNDTTNMMNYADSAIEWENFPRLHLFYCCGFNIDYIVEFVPPDEVLRQYDLDKREWREWREGDEGDVDVGFSAFHLAVYYDNLDVMKFFVETGQSQGWRQNSRRGITPMHIASANGSLLIAQYLVEEHGADTDVAAHQGATPLFMAAQEGHIEVVRYLAEQGADKDKAKNDGAAPLSIAAQEGHLSVVQYLVEQGADKNHADNDGTTPLMAACIHGHVDVAEYLLDQGCDVDQADPDGWTALHCAAQEGDLDIAQLLFRWGAKLDARNSDGNTAADVANLFGHPAIADAIRAEEIRRRDHGFKRDPSTIEGTEEHAAAKRPRAEREAEEAAAAAAAAASAVDESDDDDDDEDDDEEG